MDIAILRDYLGQVLPGLDDLADPYPVYQEMLQRDEPLRSPNGQVVVFTRYDHCAEALRHPMAKVHRRHAPELWRGNNISFIFMDPPDHTRLRGLVSRAFTKGRIDDLKDWFTERVHAALDEMADRSQVELIEDFALPLPVAGITQLLGVPQEDRAAFAAWTHALTTNWDEFLRPLTRDEQVLRRRTLREFRAYLLKLIEERRESPQDDLLSGLVQAEEEGDRLTTAELVATVQLLLQTGLETTVSAIASGVGVLAERPELRRPIAEDPKAAEGFVEEILRCYGPIQITARFAAEDMTIGNVDVPKGSVMIIVLGAANIDPRKFERPDEFDLERHGGRHVAFGSGIHFCLGAALARMEAAAALTAFAGRVVSPRVDAAGVEHRKSIVVRQLARMPIQIDGVLSRTSAVA